MFGQTDGEERYKKYITWLYKLMVEEGNKFDLVIGPANSGVFMAESVRMFCSLAGLTVPKIIILPTQRREVPGTDSGQHFDNSVLVESVKEDLKELKHARNVLFVDDEIQRAYTAKEAVSVVLGAIPASYMPDRLVYTIIAENHGFEWRYNLPPVAIRYYAFANRYRSKEGSKQEIVNGSVFYILPDSMFEKYKELTFQLGAGQTRVVGKKELAALFTNGCIKTFNGKVPVLTYELLEEVKAKVPEFMQDQVLFIKYLHALIQDVIDNYPTLSQDSVFQD